MYLTDFGTCFLKDGSERITPQEIAIGPRMFIAPEYEVGRVEAVDEKGDIFSIGKVICVDTMIKVINMLILDYIV